MRRKRSASLAVGVMVVRFILQDEMRAQNDEQTNCYAGATKQGKTTKKTKQTKTKNPMINKTQVLYPRIIQQQL